jgi:hypothetical protein
MQEFKIDYTEKFVSLKMLQLTHKTQPFKKSNLTVKNMGICRILPLEMKYGKICASFILSYYINKLDSEYNIEKDKTKLQIKNGILQIRRQQISKNLHFQILNTVYDVGNFCVG